MRVKEGGSCGLFERAAVVLMFDDPYERFSVRLLDFPPSSFYPSLISFGLCHNAIERLSLL